MPTLSFAPENKVETLSDYPRLKLDLNERKRILCLEDPTYAFVHTLRAPKIVNGKAEKKQIERKDGSTYTDFVRDFIGRPLCLGDMGILQDKGVDPKNCPACKRSVESDEVEQPQRRFAMPVVVYATKPGGFELREPFSVELVVWGFTDNTFGKLVDFAQEWGTLREHDLLLGPCSNKDFQKFDIAVSKSAAWLADDVRKKLVVATYKENRPKDLELFCGRRVERSWLIEDLNKVSDRWRIANGAPPLSNDGTEAADRAALTDGLDTLLAGSGKGEKADSTPSDLLDTGMAQQGTQPAADATTKVAEAVDLADLLGGSDPTATAQPAAKKESGEALDFDALLDL